MEMNLFWFIALIIFAVMEALTIGLTSVWFAAGTLCALIVSGMGGRLWVQLVVFLVVSLATLLLARPLAQKYLIPKRQATNADRVIGAQAVVTREINNLKGEGLVSIAGIIWTARTEDGQIIPAGESVRVLRIEGVKVFVKALPDDPEADKKQEE